MATVRAEIIGQQLIEKALLDAFETWVEQDVNGDFWDTQFKTKNIFYPQSYTYEPNFMHISPVVSEICIKIYQITKKAGPCFRSFLLYKSHHENK